MAARGVALSHRLPVRQLKQAFDMVLIAARTMTPARLIPLEALSTESHHRCRSPVAESA